MSAVLQFRLRTSPAAAAKPKLAANSPEAQLKRLFARERRLEAQMRKLRIDIALERVRYSANHGLAIYPSVQTLRSQFGPR